MSLLASVIQKLDLTLGITGRHRCIIYNNEWVDIGCIEWSRLPNILEIWANITPELEDAIQRSQEFLQQEYANEARTKINELVKIKEFFSKEPPHLQEEYAEFIDKLQKANILFDEPPAMPEFSEALKNVMANIQKRLQEENFDDGDIFDLDRYMARAKELFQDEPPQIQAELAAVTPKLKEMNALPFRIARQRKRTLKQIRILLRDEPVIAYRADIEWEGIPSTNYDAIIVAPTTDQFDILRFERTNGANHGLQTEDIITKLKILDEKYGIDIIGAGIDGVEFILKRIPKGKEAQALGEWLLDLCPDLYEAPKSFPRGKVALWWD